MAWELDGRKSIYSQIVDIILRRIVTGIYPPGSKLDSVRDLAQEAGVNPNTMQRALIELERTGIINTQRTSGKFVTEDANMIAKIREDIAKGVIDSMLGGMKELGFEKSEIIELVKEGQL